MNKVRSLLKDALPDPVLNGLRAVRASMQAPPIEVSVLEDYRFVRDDADRPRLNLIIPSLSAKNAFGGVTTCRDFFVALGDAAKREVKCEVRILTEDRYDPDDSVLPRSNEDVAVESLKDTDRAISTRRNDIFFVFNWWIALNLDAVLASQAEAYTQDIKTKFYFFQEYEPNFYAFSAANLLATEAINSKTPQHIIFNTRELLEYYNILGNQCEKAYQFEPILSPAIRAQLDGLDTVSKERIILVYGRPQIARNCFTILEKGLAEWARAMPPESGWAIYSAGMKHAPVPLGNGYAIESLGKLSLEEYSRLLRRSAIGISLMASPHPSYPPLEMAHFGMRTITNNYANKDMTRRHENLIALPQAKPSSLASVLKNTCETFDSNPLLGLEAKSFMPDFLTGEGFSCLDEVAADVVSMLADRKNNAIGMTSPAL